MHNKHIYFFSGTIAEVIKLAPIIREFKKRGINFKFVTSGQTKIHFEYLKGYTGDIKIYKQFAEKENKSSLVSFVSWAFKTLVSALVYFKNELKGINKDNSYFIIHGDTVSSLIGAIVARFYGLKIVHIESGLRSFNFLEPFPEEICRYIIIHLADLLFAPNSWAKSNLSKLRGKIINTQNNTVAESVLWALSTKSQPKKLGEHKKYYILTMHRQEHVLFRRDWTRKTLEYVINNAPQNMACILVMHNWTNKFLDSLDISDVLKKQVVKVERLPYIEFIKLMAGSAFYAGDGCSNQEEAYIMGVPFLALRNLTERIEGIGENVVISNGKDQKIKHFLDNYSRYRKKRRKLSTYPSQIVVDYLLSH